MDMTVVNLGNCFFMCVAQVNHVHVMSYRIESMSGELVPQPSADRS